MNFNDAVCLQYDEQVFALRQIIEKVQALDKSVYLNFIDFKKAFDNVHRNTLWMILRSYGIPDKILNMIASFYADSRCSVQVNSTLGKWFEMFSKVRQGCLLSPLLFAVAMDRVMRRAVETTGQSGIHWTQGERLTDLDFADDVV